jgi:hypothetical protein
MIRSETAISLAAESGEEGKLEKDKVNNINAKIPVIHHKMKRRILLFG